ncbi:MAG: transporter [Candidatus Krumholzibacteria bacterium]|nr:transporter [Candidatus Krumholzibacteria bacterium]
MNFSKMNLILWAITMAFGCGSAVAQDLEPRAFSQAPVGMNFAVVSVGYSEGQLLFDQATTLEDVTGEVTNVAAAYVRTLNVLGASAKASVVLPIIWGDWAGIYQGVPETASRRGFADPLAELSVNFLGAPAMKMSEMRNYTQKWVVGASLRMSAPVGQYDAERLISLGTNRWAARPRLGASYKSGPWNLEAKISAWIYVDNDEFLGDSLLEQEPLWSTQYSVVYQWPSKIWVGLGAGVSRGGQTSTDGVETDTYKKNTRWVGVLSMPLNAQHSLKLLYVNGVRTRSGSDFDNVSLAWAMHWGGRQ